MSVNVPVEASVGAASLAEASLAVASLAVTSLAVTSLAVASTGVGVAGITSDGPALTYSPPCSQGPGAMMYTYTVYALSAHPTLPARARDVTGAVLTDAIRAITLASASATVTYTR